MKKYRLIVDSSCDLPTEFYEKYDIGVTPLVLNFNERQYVDRVEITSKEILKIYNETKIFPKTSALNIPELEKVFTENLKEYEHIFYMPISSKISSIYNNARLAIQDLKVADRVTLLDSASLSGGVGLEAIGICEDINKGLTPEEILNNHNERIDKVSMHFIIDTMEFLHKGGRCSGLTYFLGNKLSLHPIIALNNGKMGVHTVVLGKEIKGVKRMLEDFNTDFENNNVDFDYPIFVPHVEGEDGVKKIMKELTDKVGKNIILPVEASGIICCHCGKDTVGLGYMRKNPLKK